MPDDDADGAIFALEGGDEPWDQFAVNHEKFGVKTTFNEDIYTVKLDRGKCGITEADAARIAREIELGVHGNASLARNIAYAEEAGLEVDDLGVSPAC